MVDEKPDDIMLLDASVNTTKRMRNESSVCSMEEVKPDIKELELQNEENVAREPLAQQHQSRKFVVSVFIHHS